MKNLGNMLKEAQKLQSRMTEMQQKLAETEMSGAAGGGMVDGHAQRQGRDAQDQDRPVAGRSRRDRDPGGPDRRRLQRRQGQDRGATCRRRWASSPAACRCRPGSSCRSDGVGRDRAAGPSAGAAARPRPALGAARGAGHAEAPRHADAAAGRRAARPAPSAVRPCPVCGNLDTVEPCAICRDPERDARPALRRGRASRICGRWSGPAIFRGRYHVLGGTLQGAGRHRPGGARRRPAAAPGRRSRASAR